MLRVIPSISHTHWNLWTAEWTAVNCWVRSNVAQAGIHVCNGVSPSFLTPEICIAGLGGCRGWKHARSPIAQTSRHHKMPPIGFSGSTLNMTLFDLNFIGDNHLLLLIAPSLSFSCWTLVTQMLKMDLVAFKVCHSCLEKQSIQQWMGSCSLCSETKMNLTLLPRCEFWLYLQYDVLFSCSLGFPPIVFLLLCCFFCVLQ